MIRIYKILTILIILFSIPANASNDINRILSLVDYIGGDYKNAVKNGRTINKEEYQEMTDFSSTILNLWNNSSQVSEHSANFKNKFLLLQSKINSKDSVKEVELLTSNIKESLISEFGLKPYPKNPPDISKGKLIYNTNCTSCHGYKGDGDGVLSKNLTPPPTNFTETSTVAVLSPFKVYNTVTFGIEGTSMPSFKTLNDGEKWDVGFYVLSLGFPGGDGNSSISSSGPKLPENIKDYKNLATISNEELISKISSLGIKNPDEKLALLRTTNIQNRSSNNSDNPINFTLSKLSDSVLFYKANKHKDSLDAAIDAYLEGFEKVEADLMAKNSSLVMEIEKNMTILRSSIKSGDNVAEIENHVELLRTDIEKAEKTLSESSIGPYVTFINSFSIILREALEAILIIAAIIAFLSVSGAKSSIKYIHYGWIAAILAGFVTWFLAKSILEISGASREVVEGITAILAAIVLFYVSYWLISKIEVEKWKDYVKSKVKRAIDKKSIIALTSVSFLAVYREAFETVLFYQALLYQSESSAMPVIWGLLAGIVIISIVAVLIFKLSIRIPLKYFFSFTSLFLYILCFILVGKGIKELQAAGFIPASKLEFIPYIDVLGMYPTYETTVPQLVIVLAFIFAFFWIAYVTQVKAKQEINTSVARISDEIKTVQASFDHIKGHIVEWRKCDDIDLEAEELDQQIHEVADDFDQLKNKLEKFNITLGNM